MDASCKYELWIKGARVPVGFFATRLLHAATNSTETPLYEEIEKIYDDDGRGTIRDYMHGKFILLGIELEIVFDRTDLCPVNFRITGEGIELEQIPVIANTPLHFIGESTNRYRLVAPKETARRIVSTIVSDLDGYKTEADIQNQSTRIDEILEGNDPLCMR